MMSCLLNDQTHFQLFAIKVSSSNPIHGFQFYGDLDPIHFYGLYSMTECYASTSLTRLASEKETNGVLV